MDFFSGLPTYILPFLVVLTVIIFVHEAGHYLVARWNGVKVEVFSIGFGPELFGWFDRRGTRWKVSAIPLGGYVKFFGDASAASEADGAALESMSPAQRAVSFHHKRLSQRSAIVVAGPAANFIFAIVVYAALFSTVGQPFTPAVVSGVLPGSPAEAAGFEPGDKVIQVDGTAIERFEELRTYVALRAETPIEVTVLRRGAPVRLTVTPARVDLPDGFGGTHKVGQIGIRFGGLEFKRHSPPSAAWYAVRETATVVGATFTYVGRVVTGRESGEQISGPLGIAKISGDVAQVGLVSLVSLMAMLSVAIGLINIFPVPLLDGGHLLFYGIEALRGRPLSARVQEYGFRIGLALVLSLMLFATWNDLNRLQVISFITGLFS
jgi:regulator of sigma E protease